ncbi:cathepsin L-like [Drosophila nasuta]|uniref:cathepsin L-like n=1 Tax=Drosophila nasuta TaxID=42062 RepID=UPI00295E3501|nr:cathepsin L-like [Drosophila nasuta]
MNTKLFLATLLGLLAYSQARITLTKWEAFKQEFNKSYDNEFEERFRMQVFEDNKRIIDTHNERFAIGEETYEMGFNEYTDLLDKEFDGMFDGSEIEDFEFTHKDDDELKGYNDEVDWRILGAITPVKQEGHFNNSWAFATAGVVESRKFISTGVLLELSKQQLIDCSSNKHDSIWRALKYIKSKKGIEAERAYPYRGVKGHCKFNKRLISASIRKYHHSSTGNERTLAKQVAKGPVAAMISRDAIRFYRSGVFHNPNCRKSPEYAVLIVGYGNSKSFGEYWLLKTSLGTSWGEKGYLKLARNKNNLCGIASRAYFPDI